jgi:hypothetical protein
METPDEFGPEGAGEARSEHAHSYSTKPELHVSFRGQWWDDEGEDMRPRRKVGF